MRPLFAMTAALLLSTAALAQGDAGPDRAMTASIVEGAVTVLRGGGAEPLAQGTLLHEGDVIQTGADSRLEIAMSDGSTLRLGESAKLELRVAPPAGRVFAARLLLGAVWAKVHKLLQDESFHVETENAVAGVRGTEFVVEASRASGDDNVRVYEGSVEVRDHGGGWMHAVEAGRELSVRRGVRPDGPKPFDPASDRQHPLVRWVRERPVRPLDPADRGERRAPAPEKQDRERPARRQRLFDRSRGR